VDAVGALVERASTGTDSGGSEIDRPLPTNPLDYPYAAFTVLFRPTILEANSVATFVASIETMAVLGLFVLSWRRLANLPAVIVRRPYVLMCIVYTGIFAFAWSSFSNLGALARQRVQMWPFLLLLLAIPLVLDARKLRGMARDVHQPEPAASSATRRAVATGAVQRHPPRPVR
jgi:hypothetical protein